MARAYNRPPGVVVRENTDTTINPILATPDRLCLVGPASGGIEITEAVKLTGTTAVKLKGVKSSDVMTSESILRVLDADTRSAQSTNGAYTSTGGYFPRSYTFNETDHTIARASSGPTGVTLSAAISNSATTIVTTATVTTGFDPDGGTLVIDNEQILYSSATVPSTGPNSGKLVFTVGTNGRGYNGTLAKGHTNTSTASLFSYIAIPDEHTVYVTYQYTPSDYYQPYIINNGEFSKIQSRFGKAFDDDGLIVKSPLTLAAKIAIENGARDLVLQPVFYSADDIDGEMPARTQAENDQLIESTDTWDKSFRSLQSVEGIGVIVPIVGQNYEYKFGKSGGNAAELTDDGQIGILEALQQHIEYMESEYDQLIIGIVGEDSSNNTNDHTYASRTQLINHIGSLQSYYSDYNVKERIVFIAQTYFERPSTKNATTRIALGGQYAAAAVGGRLISYTPEVSLTRKAINGFKSVVDTRTKKTKTQDSGLGFLVIENNPSDGRLIVRHALTIDNTSVATSELNAVRSKHYMINSLRNTIDSQIIGQVVADETAPVTIVSTVASTLRTLQDDGVIVQFDSVQAQIDSIDPTEIGIRFNYRPAFAVNYVNIEFSIDLSSGITSLTTTDQANIGA